MPEIPQRTFGEALLRSALRFPEKTAIISRGKEYSYEEFLVAAERLACHLVTQGVKRGDRVAIMMHNSWQTAVSIYATSLAGAVFLAINVQTKAGKLNYILNDSGAVVLLSESILIEEIEAALSPRTMVNMLILTGEKVKKSHARSLNIYSFEQIIDNRSIVFPLPKVIPNDLAALIYTSGSTGFPKGVMMTHQSMVFTSWSLIEYLRLDAEDRIMLLLPLAFDYGLYQLIMSVTLGATLIVELSFTFQASIYESIRKNLPTVFPGVPTIYAMMIASNKESGITFPCVRRVTNTAAALPREFIPGLKKIFPEALIFPMYGLTECKRVCYLEPELVDSKPGSVGKAIPGTEVYLLSPDGAPVPAGQRGILHVRGPHVMLGYWHQEELTGQMLKSGELPGERVLCTNDWFIMDEDGFLYFQGRNDDIIKTRGEKVSPLEVENVIYQLDEVREAAVIGIPDELLGESIVAFVSVYPGMTINEGKVFKACQEQLELFMVPSVVHLQNELPKSANGKIDKRALKTIYSSPV